MSGEQFKEVVKTNKGKLSESVFVYTVCGLNIFSVNDVNEFGDIPFMMFLGLLKKNYRVAVLISAMAIKELSVEMKKFLVLNVALHETVVNIYGGIFYLINEKNMYFEIPSKYSGHIIPKLVSTFMPYDAVAYFFYKNSTFYMEHLSNYLSEFKYSCTKKGYIELSQEKFLEPILDNAEAVLISQGDLQCLEILTKRTEFYDSLKDVSSEVNTFVTRTQWFKKNKTKLIWSDVECCYVVKES